MATGNAARIIRAPGRVIVNPTLDFNDYPYPYGGVEIGRTTGVVLRPLGSSFRVECEARGETTDVLESDNRYVLGMVIRGKDDDAVELLLSDGYSEGAISQHAVWSAPGISTPGESGWTRSVSIVYVPDDPVRVDAVMVYAGIPGWADGAEVTFSRGEEVVIPLAVECLSDGQDRIVAVGRLADLEP